jgi:hypothetical protein
LKLKRHTCFWDNRRMDAVIVGTIVGGLALDQYWPAHGQLAVSIATWVVFAACGTAAPRASASPSPPACSSPRRRGLPLARVGLYAYRLGNIPLFVPPGHVLLFFLGTRIAARLADGAEWWIAAGALPLVALFAGLGRDTLGPLLLRALPRLHGSIPGAQALRDDVRAVARHGALRDVARQLALVRAGCRGSGSRPTTRRSPRALSTACWIC